MRDGVRIAIEVVLPENLSSNDKLTAILVQTRYWRDYILRAPFRWFMDDIPDTKTLHKIGVKRGYAFVRVDVRGTGASFGTRPYPWHINEVEDGREIIDWIIKQPWSDGNIVAVGGSYVGVTSEYLATLNHPAVKGVIPMSNQWDVFTEVAAPGGIFNHFFIRIWGYLGRALDKNESKNFKSLNLIYYLFLKSVKPVESDIDRTLLKAAIKEHSDNTYVFENEDLVFFKDDVLVKQQKATADTVSVALKKDLIEKSKVPFYCWGSWLDGVTGENIISRFMTYSNPMRAVIGDWDHGANRRANPYFYKKYKVQPNKEEQINAWLDFFDVAKKGGFAEKQLYYYTMGEEKWKVTEKWPPENHSMQTWYLEKNGFLSDVKPESQDGADSYKVDFNLSTGQGNRWHVHYAQKMYYNNLENLNEKMLTYTTHPLKEDIEITGHCIIKLYLSSTHEDGAIFVYLEDIDENENIVYLTEGELRLIHHKVSNEKPPYEIFIPFHSYKKADSKPLIPGEITDITFGLAATSVLVRKNHRIRIAISGADIETFSRYPAEGDPTITVLRNRINPSHIEIPIISK